MGPGEKILWRSLYIIDGVGFLKKSSKSYSRCMIFREDIVAFLSV